MLLKGGRVFDVGSGFTERDLFFEDGIITSEGSGETLDVSDCYIIPGLTDLHFHGCVGADLSDADAEGLIEMAKYELSRGVTQICPAGMTLLPDQLISVCKTAAGHTCDQGAELVGINLEGPFLSAAKKGAQNGEWLCEPDINLLDKLISASGGLAKLVTIAPELPGAMEFIDAAKNRITISLGHTAANFDTAQEAFKRGAREVTHLYNAMPPFSHRSPGVVGAAADNENVFVELICDGIHVHPSVVRSTFRLFGRERVILISDSIRATGLKDGSYTLGGQEVTVRGNLSTLPDGTIAGSVTDLMNCVKTAVSFRIPLFDAVMAATVNPAKVLGIYDRFGSLDTGKCANVVVLGPDLELKAVFFKGKQVF